MASLEGGYKDEATTQCLFDLQMREALLSAFPIGIWQFGPTQLHHFIQQRCWSCVSATPAIKSLNLKQ